MQFNQPCFPTGFTSGAQFVPFNTTFQTQCMQQFPEVVGEGEVVTLGLPDGSVQLYFLPTNKWTHSFMPISNKSSYWFVKSVANPIPHPIYCQTQFVSSGLPSPRLTLGCSGSFEIPNQFLNPCPAPPPPVFSPYKFHSDGATSTSDIHYFFPRLNKCNANKLCTGVQVIVPAQSSSCQSEGVSCVSSSCGQRNCNCCNGKCEGATDFSKEASSQVDTKKRKRDDVTCKCYPKPKIQRSAQSQTCMSVDKPRSRYRLKRKKEKRCRNIEPKNKSSTHSQTSMSIDEYPPLELNPLKSKKQKQDKSRTERKKTKRKRSSSSECSCSRNRKKQKKNKNSKDKKKVNRGSSINCVSCKCSDTSMSAKSPKKHYPERAFDSRSKNKYTDSFSSEIDDCSLCESCLSEIALQNMKNSSEEISCKCYSSTDTNLGMSVDPEITGNKYSNNKSTEAKKTKQKGDDKANVTCVCIYPSSDELYNKPTEDKKTQKKVDKDIRDHSKKQEKQKDDDKASVTCVCIYPSSDDSSKSMDQKQPRKKTPHESKKIRPQNASTYSTNPFSSPLRQKSSNSPVEYKPADFCECFPNLGQPPTKYNIIERIEKGLKRKRKSQFLKRQDKIEPRAICKCSDGHSLIENEYTNYPNEKEFGPLVICKCADGLHLVENVNMMDLNTKEKSEPVAICKCADEFGLNKNTMYPNTKEKSEPVATCQCAGGFDLSRSANYLNIEDPRQGPGVIGSDNANPTAKHKTEPLVTCECNTHLAEAEKTKITKSKDQEPVAICKCQEFSVTENEKTKHRKDKSEPLADCKCEFGLEEINNGPDYSTIPVNTDSWQNTDINSRNSEFSKDLAQRQCAIFDDLCECGTPSRTPSELARHSYLDHSSIPDSNKFNQNGKTGSLHSHASNAPPKYASSIKKHYSF